MWCVLKTVWRLDLVWRCPIGRAGLEVMRLNDERGWVRVSRLTRARKSCPAVHVLLGEVLTLHQLVWLIRVPTVWIILIYYPSGTLLSACLCFSLRLFSSGYIESLFSPLSSASFSGKTYFSCRTYFHVILSLDLGWQTLAKTELESQIVYHFEQRPSSRVINIQSSTDFSFDSFG